MYPSLFVVCLTSTELPLGNRLCRPVQAVSDRAGDDGGNTDYAAVAASLNNLLASTKVVISGKELRSLVLQKWGRSYEVRLCRLQGKMYLQVMWKFLEQASFPLSEPEYMEQLNAVAEYLNEWGVAETVRQGIMAARRPPGYTGGTAARCVSIPLAVDLGGARSAEWA
ncbi:hypothetical protein TSOC_012108 [Tetrabaena socialis]|uniref:Uncharacterized protein n=1 Tax=Tetrabaena socialis TaxID=47790 RepID=A0A2J7ZNV7_9CHLO|nr:hypothetical protein TSOC_012108 [Tetrabaena socialis]|eukprot:PNH01951.1 hypothetical protein TSOC_012108 [Tetrabaena socialis]